MQISITARHIDLTRPFKVYVNEKLKKLNKYTSRIEEAHVVFSLERFNYISEIILTGKRVRMAAVEKDRNLEASFDKSAVNIEKQLKRFWARVKDHNVCSFSEGLKRLSMSIKKQTKSSPPRIIRTDSFVTKPMSPEEAALELEVFNRDFIVFHNSNDDRVNVLYRRKDGNYGLIEP